MCYQRDIGEQFELLQSKFANDERFLRDTTSIDPVIGQMRAHVPLPQQWPMWWNAPGKNHKSFSFYGFVTLKGGEYFFAPSRNFLRTI
jgi:hypothetical protein